MSRNFFFHHKLIDVLCDGCTRNFTNIGVKFSCVALRKHRQTVFIPQYKLTTKISNFAKLSPPVSLL